MKKSLLLLLSVAAVLIASAQPSCPQCKEYPADAWKVLLISLPAIIFLYLLFYFLRWLKKEKYQLSDALSSDQATDTFTIRITKTDPAHPGQSVTEERTEPNYARSSSRLIAFITGITAIVISVCLVTYYAYAFILQTAIPDFDAAWNIIAGLGIGVVPYVSKVIKGDNPHT